MIYINTKEKICNSCEIPRHKKTQKHKKGSASLINMNEVEYFTTSCPLLILKHRFFGTCLELVFYEVCVEMYCVWFLSENSSVIIYAHYNFYA